jgi:murein DD-endopeptidase MepM/ murein hydrolase activator NlpD
LSLSALLQKHQAEFGPVLPVDLNGTNVTRLDFSAANALVANADLRGTAAFEVLVAQLLVEQSATIGIGGYLEDRVIYRRSAHFGSGAAEEARSLHLGVDVWLPAGTPVMAPLAATIHSLADNNNFGDYGPTVILQHELESTTFYSLYGHLSRQEWRSLRVGQVLPHGEAFATVGPFPENGDWPPHLHFQLIGRALPQPQPDAAKPAFVARASLFNGQRPGAGAPIGSGGLHLIHTRAQARQCEQHLAIGRRGSQREKCHFAAQHIAHAHGHWAGAGR